MPPEYALIRQNGCMTFDLESSRALDSSFGPSRLEAGKSVTLDEGEISSIDMIRTVCGEDGMLPGRKGLHWVYPHP